MSDSWKQNVKTCIYHVCIKILLNSDLITEPLKLCLTTSKVIRHLFFAITRSKNKPNNQFFDLNSVLGFQFNS